MRYWLFLSLVLLAFHASSDEQRPSTVQFRLGIFPYMEARQTIALWGPVAENLQHALSHRVSLVSSASFSEFVRELESGKFDIALIQPFDFSLAVEKLGYIPIAQLNAPLVTEFVVRDDSKYHSLEDLRGSLIAAPPEDAANSRMLVRALVEKKIMPGRDAELKFFKSHDSCLQQVWAGVASACGTAGPPIMIFEQRMKAKFRTIYRTPGIPHVMLIASKSIPVADRDKLQQTILGWTHNDSGRQLMKNLGFPGFREPHPEEYASLKKYFAPVEFGGAGKVRDKELILGIFPYLGARQLVQNFSGMLPSLSRVTGSPVYIRTSSNFDAFSDDISSFRFDLIIVQPFEYANATRHGYLPLAGMKNTLEGTFFVKESDNSVSNIADFKGKVVAMPPVTSAQSRLGRNALVKAGLKPGVDVTIDYRNTHESCLQQVHLGVAVACITSRLTLSMLPIEIGEGLRQVGKTENIPGVLIMSHKRVPAAIRNRLKAEIISWKDTKTGREILKPIGFGDFVDVDEVAYRNLPDL